MRLLYVLVLTIGFPLMCIGQLNLSVQYSPSYTNPTVHQNIINQFNADRSWLSTPFKDMNWLNGYGLGLRYKIDRIAFDVRWENQIDRITAFGDDPVNGNFEQVLFFKLSTYSIGLESFINDHFSIHGNFELNNARYRSEINDSDRFEIMKDWGTGSTFSIGYNFIGSGLMHVSIRPFVHFSWSRHDLTQLNDSLNPDVTTVMNLEEEFLNYGIKIIFYNGPWD